MIGNFDKSLDFVLSWEGGHSFDPDDPGGETYKGVARKKNPQWKGWRYVDEKKFKEADGELRAFYKEDFWDKLNCDNLPYPLDLCCFDCAVNMGVSRALNFLSVTQDWRDYLMYRIMRYTDLGKSYPKFLRGWLNRVLALWKLVKGGGQ